MSGEKGRVNEVCGEENLARLCLCFAGHGGVWIWGEVDALRGFWGKHVMENEIENRFLKLPWGHPFSS